MINYSQTSDRCATVLPDEFASCLNCYSIWIITSNSCREHDAFQIENKIFIKTNVSHDMNLILVDVHRVCVFLWNGNQLCQPSFLVFFYSISFYFSASDQDSWSKLIFIIKKTTRYTHSQLQLNCFGDAEWLWYQCAAIKHIRSNDWSHLIRADIDIDSIILYDCMDCPTTATDIEGGRQRI